MIYEKKPYIRIRPIYSRGGSWAFAFGVEGGVELDELDGIWAFGIIFAFWVIEFGKKEVEINKV